MSVRVRDRVEFTTEHGCAPIKGASFTFRTLNAPDGRFGHGTRGPRITTLDRLITITLPAIDGEDHKMVPTMEVCL
jgi:hypothetical protein